MATSQAYAVGRVRVLERSLIGRAGLNRLLSAKSPDEFCRMLSELNWGEAANQREVDELAQKHVRDASELLLSASPSPKVTDCFSYNYDVHNLKLLFKAQALGKISDVSALPLMSGGTVSIEGALKAVRDGHFEAFAPEIADAAVGISRALIVKADPLSIDSELDKAMYRQIAHNVKHGAPTQIKEYFTAQTDIKNLLIRLRVKSMERTGEFAYKLMLAGGSVDAQALADANDASAIRALYSDKGYYDKLRRALEAYEQTGELSQVEKLENDYLLGLIEKYRFEPTSILPLLGYMLARQREAVAVRMIMTALMNRFPMDKLRERLSDMYGN